MLASSSVVRVAVEGCGHGTLDAIYASIEESCRVKGWDGVDLVIIGGDFQAVRNQHDLNVTAMPQKYRQMADFHKYYSGTKAAPYLTIFIGGNHEASNHLFELYYGGWVAPDIYYLGAANVIRFGPLRIAGLSGIWDHRDVHKPHFERLPYNDDDMRSIYHVRELDVRKLLSFSSQVDIALSHDWPRGVEWLGDHDLLFKKKSFLREDAETGKLGSVAARQCLDRLRPTHWFSAHLHVKYPAIVDHGEYIPVRHASRWPQNKAMPKSRHYNGDFSASSTDNNTRGPAPTAAGADARNDIGRVFAIPAGDRESVQAWQGFRNVAPVEDAAARDRHLEELARVKEEEKRTGRKTGPGYKLKETFKQVTTDDDLRRKITSVQTEERLPEGAQEIPNLDGCGSSRLKTLKRRREVYNSDEIDIDDSDEEDGQPDLVTAPNVPSNLDGTNISSETEAAPTSKNPDEIDIDMSDEEEGSGKYITDKGTAVGNNPDEIDIDTSEEEPPTNTRMSEYALPGHDDTITQLKRSNNTVSARPTTLSSEDGGVALHSEDHQGHISSISSVIENTHTSQHGDTERETRREMDNQVSAEAALAETVPEAISAQLAQLSADFAPVQKIEMSAALPLPETISNKTTKFLALSKCEKNQDFLQLMEIEGISEFAGAQDRGPFRLSYDPEWLAILRVFAPELALGGQSNDAIPQHRGDTYYRDRIDEERNWIDQNVAQPGLLEVPDKFELTAPKYDPSLPVDTKEMPKEVTNPQTSAFCALIGIDNLFDIGHEEREARTARPERVRGDRRGRGGRSNNFIRGGDRNRGGRGGRRGGRGWR